MTWATLDDVREGWDDAPMNDELLLRKLVAAHAQCVAYAPALPVGPIPANYVEAEVLATRELYQADKRDGDIIGYGDGYAVRARPLSSTVKGLLHPRRGRRVVR